MNTSLFLFADDSRSSGSDDVSTHADGGGPADVAGDALGAILP